MSHIEWTGGKPRLVLDPEEFTPSARRDLLRGIFCIVEHDVEGKTETRLVLQGFDPENRKLVYTVDWFPGTPDAERLGPMFVATKVQDAPDLARPQDTKLERWAARLW